MLARFRLGNEMLTEPLIQENNKTILVQVKKKGVTKIIKRHKIKHSVIVIPIPEST